MDNNALYLHASSYCSALGGWCSVCESSDSAYVVGVVVVAAAAVAAVVDGKDVPGC